MRKMIAFVLLALLVSLASAQTLQDYLARWEPISVLAAMLSVLIIGFLYMFAEALDIPSLKASLRVELTQLFYTFALLAVLIAGVNFINSDIMPGMVQALAGANVPVNSISGAALPDKAVWLTETQLEAVNSFKSHVETQAAEVGKSASLSSYCQVVGALGFNKQTCPMLSTVQTPLSALAQSTGLPLLSLNAQQLIMQMTKGAVFNLFIPLGVLLRMFSYTRKAAGAFIGIGIGFYVAYPAMIVLNHGILYAMQGAPAAYTALSHSFEAPSGLSSTCNDAINGQIQSPELQRWVSRNLFLGGIFFPIMNVMVTLFVVKALAGVAGSDIEVSALARIT